MSCRAPRAVCYGSAVFSCLDVCVGPRSSRLSRVRSLCAARLEGFLQDVSPSFKQTKQCCLCCAGRNARNCTLFTSFLCAGVDAHRAFGSPVEQVSLSAPLEQTGKQRHQLDIYGTAGVSTLLRLENSITMKINEYLKFCSI